MPKTNFMHIRGRYNRDLTVAYNDQIIGSSHHLLFAVAVCSSKDQFNKKIGRLVSEGRLNKNDEFKNNCFYFILGLGNDYSNQYLQNIIVSKLDDHFNQ